MMEMIIQIRSKRVGKHHWHNTTIKASQLRDAGRLFSRKRNSECLANQSTTIPGPKYMFIKNLAYFVGCLLLVPQKTSSKTKATTSKITFVQSTATGTNPMTKFGRYHRRGRRKETRATRVAGRVIS
jgi:hypothetical protein